MPPPGVRLGITLDLAVELVKVLLFFEWQGKMDVALQASISCLISFTEQTMYNYNIFYFILIGL